jgi:hypothetical protein
LEKLAIEVLIALGERDAAIAATEEVTGSNRYRPPASSLGGISGLRA